MASITIENEIINAIRKRRAIYPSMYTGDSIDDQYIEAILESANWAPTHKLTQPWRFIVFSGSSKKKLADYCSSWYKENTPSASFSSMKYEKTQKKVYSSSHVIAICMERDKSEQVPEWEEISSVAMAVQNMWLTCSSLGLGCYWSSSRSALEATQFLELKRGQKCLGWFYIGQPKDTLDLRGVRTDIKQKVTWLK